VYVRFAQPLALGETTTLSEDVAGGDGPDRGVVTRMGFEVCSRIEQITPIKSADVLTMVLLGANGRALTASEIHAQAGDIANLVRQRGLPAASGFSLEDEEQVRAAVLALQRSGLIRCFDKANAPVYYIPRAKKLAAAYYRNTVIHFFLSPCIAELGLLRAAGDSVEDRLAAFWEEAMRLRDLLKFEFFFEEKDEFLETFAGELARLAPDWRDHLAEGTDGVLALLDAAETLSSDMMLRAFLEAYLIVADELASLRGGPLGPEGQLLARCEARGAGYVKEGIIRSPEAVSRHLFATALKLAVNRGLGEGDGELAARRDAFSALLRNVIHRMSVVRHVAVRRVQALAGREPSPGSGARV